MKRHFTRLSNLRMKVSQEVTHTVKSMSNHVVCSGHLQFDVLVSLGYFQNCLSIRNVTKISRIFVLKYLDIYLQISSNIWIFINKYLQISGYLSTNILKYLDILPQVSGYLSSNIWIFIFKYPQISGYLSSNILKYLDIYLQISSNILVISMK